jgi:hypothetical protein
LIKSNKILKASFPEFNPLTEQDDPYNPGFALNYMAQRVGGQEIEKIKQERQQYFEHLNLPKIQPSFSHSHNQLPAHRPNSNGAMFSYNGSSKFQVRKTAIERRNYSKTNLIERQKALSNILFAER